jgi:hypothetical protein
MAKTKKSKNGSKRGKKDALAIAFQTKKELGKLVDETIDERVDASVKELFKLLMEAASKEENDLSPVARELAAYWYVVLARWQETPTMEEDIPKEDANLA